MRRIEPRPDWPEAWLTSYAYDLMEVYGDSTDVAYTRRYGERHNRSIKAILDIAGPGARVLDVAGAQGNFSIELAERGFDVTWNDLRAELAGYVEAKRESGSISYAPGDIFKLSFEPFDVVLMTEVIEHVAHPDQFLAHVASLVRPGGHIVMTTPNGEFFKNKLPRFSECADPSAFENQQFKPNSDGHIFLLHEDEVHSLAQRAGLVVDQFDFFTNFVTAGFVKSAGFGRKFPQLTRRLEVATTTWNGIVGRRVNVQMLALMRKV